LGNFINFLSYFTNVFQINLDIFKVFYLVFQFFELLKFFRDNVGVIEKSSDEEIDVSNVVNAIANLKIAV
jgi:hypothetical protein